MNLVCIGLSFHTAPVAVRERLAFTPTSLRSMLGWLAGTGRPAGLREVVILSTCNRTELYAALDGEAPPDGVPEASPLIDALAEGASVARAAVEPHLYIAAGPAAMRHLMAVAAGVDSMIVGEAEILGQVGQAAAEARALGASGPVLDALFVAAQRAGRRARRETAIGSRAASVPSAAVQLARDTVGDIARCHVALVGAGQMGVLAAKALVGQGARSLVVSNRSYERAVALANTWEGCAVTFDRLTDAIAAADIVVASTSAPHPVLRRADVEPIMAGRPERPLLIIDIAVPRDVEPDVGGVPGVRLFDIDDLAATVEGNLAERSAAIPGVAEILDAETTRFERWLATSAATPDITALQQWADTVRERELRRTLRRLEHLGDADRAAVRAMAEALVAKLLHPPIARLRAAAGDAPRFRDADLMQAMAGDPGPDREARSPWPG